MKLIACIAYGAMVIASGFGDFLSRAIVPSGASLVKKTYVKRKDKYSCDQLYTKIRLAERIMLYLRKTQGHEFADRLLAGTNLQMPHKFWIRFISEELEMQYDACQRLRCYRCMQYYVACWRQGKRTPIAMLDGVPRHSKRKVGRMGFCFEVRELGSHFSWRQARICV